MKSISLFLLLILAGGARAQEGVAGHYYLNGVMEVGSELLLRDDGRFQWYLSYGALDQQAQGQWQQHDGRVTLQADAPGKNRPWAYLKDSTDWDEEADHAWLLQAHAMAREAMHARCPFLDAGADVVSATVPVVDADGTTAHAPADLDHAIAAQESRLAGFVQRAEQAAAAAMSARGTPRETAAMQAATQAMSDYWREQYALKDLYWQRPGPAPAYATLDLPPQCTEPAEPVRAADASQLTSPRTAVLVRDEETDRSYEGMPITLLFADGQGQSLKSGEGGYAFAGQEGGAMPVTVRIGGEEQVQAGLPVLSLPVPAGARRVLRIELDPPQTSAFETMELRIEGDELIPIWPDGREQGRYSRD